ncbi:MAG: VWA domain-containing protein, partial [Geminicoccaceae bacterium]
MTEAASSVPTERKRFEPGRFAVNIMHFARALRAAGMPVGPGKVLDAIRAVEAVGLSRRADFYWTLHAVFVNRRDQRELFDQAFHIFWRKPDLLEKAMQLLLPQIESDQIAPQEIARRLAEALGPQKTPGQGEAPEEGEPPIELAATLSFAAREILQHTDFEDMSADEIAEAKALIRAMRLPIRAVPTRRFHPDPRGWRVDLRKTLRRSLHGGGAMIDLAKKR